MSNEIERKFLISGIPDNKEFKKIKTIKQAYLFLSENEEIRIRRTELKCTQTIKKGSGILREEVEIQLEEKQFNELWKLTKGKRIIKTRYKLEHDNYIIELDEYTGALKNLFVAEVEFSSVREALFFEKPSFFLDEITYDPRYKNKNLAVMNSNSIKRLLNFKKSEIIIGTLPFYKKGEEVKVVMVTTKNGKQWIFPKGHYEKSLTKEQVALMEAKEEAGINGIIAGPPIVLPCQSDGKTLNMLAFPIEVKKLSKSWEENSERTRKKVTIKDAYKLTTRKFVHYGLKYIEALSLITGVKK